MTHLTIRDIARMAGVSTTAVSFVLNNRPGVSDKTRKRVQDIIQRTGFTPNVHTRRLNLGKSFTIHVALLWYEYSLFNQFALETLFGIFKAGKELGYGVMFTFVDEHMDSQTLMESIRSKDCDGVILNQILDPTLIELLQEEQIPFVCADAHTKKDGTLPVVEVDYYETAYKATMYLYENGHTEIGFIGPERPAEFHRNTLAGFTDALRDSGLIYNPAWMPKLTFSEESAEACIDELLQCTWLPTAFFCAGDTFAVDTLRCAKARGLRVPQDISIMSMDDLLVSRYTDPPLSSMTFDKAALGERAMRVLHKIINGEPHEMISLIPTSLVKRSSVMNIHK